MVMIRDPKRPPSAFDVRVLDRDGNPIARLPDPPPIMPAALAQPIQQARRSFLVKVDSDVSISIRRQ